MFPSFLLYPPTIHFPSVIQQGHFSWPFPLNWPDRHRQYIQCESSFRLLPSYLIKYAQYKKENDQKSLLIFLCCCCCCRRTYVEIGALSMRMECLLLGSICWLACEWNFFFACAFRLLLCYWARCVLLLLLDGKGVLSISRAQRIIQTQTQRTFILCWWHS